MKTTANPEEVMAVMNGEHKNPHNILGIHEIERPDGKKRAYAVRAWFPGAQSIDVICLADNIRYPMACVHGAGFFETLVEDRKDYIRYSFEVAYSTDNIISVTDPYCFLPMLSEFDLYLFNEGTHHRIYEKLGAHIKDACGIQGTLFTVWAPCARRVSVIGDFNMWDGRVHQMRCIGNSGVWEIFLPGVGKDALYKYEVKTCSGEIYYKADPYAFRSELRPGTASVVYDMEGYCWGDADWIRERDGGNIFEKPVSIYEVHLGSWSRVPDEGDRFLSYTELADKLVPYVRDMGYTHIELLPVTEHPFDGSWGYQVTGYYAATSRYGTPEEFMGFVDACHREGIGVIMDWVPGHFPKDGHGLARFDGTALYEHENKMQGEQPDWGTHIFNFGRHEVRNFLVSNAMFWFEKYHIDGLRVDAVASMLYLDYAKQHGEWVPNRWGGRENVDAIEFMRQLNTTVYNYFPGIMMIAEESSAWAMVSKPPYTGGLGFSFKWNMGWMNDFLRYAGMDSVYRKYHHHLLTFSIMYAYSENFILVLSHDEVVHGKCSMISKMPGDYWQKFAGLRACYGYFYGHPGKKLLFMGGEFAHFIEWNYKSSLDWHLLDYEMHRKMQRYVKDLNRLYKSEKALHEQDYSFEGFEWLDCNDAEHSILTFMRKGRDWHDMLIFVCNFTPVKHDCYRIPAPFDLWYDEVLNSDSEIYGGSNAGNMGGVHAEWQGLHGRPYSMGLTVPPYGALVLKPRFEGPGCDGK